MDKIKELYYRYLAKQIRRQKYSLYQATIFNIDETEEIIANSKYTYKRN